MAGIYFHIPFCRQACYYCDFHFSTNQTQVRRMVEAMRKEIILQKNYLAEPLNTIYFGGGTPSLLSFEQLETLLQTVWECFEVAEKVEITLEANPDDIDLEKLLAWKSLKINRLSIGIQSFHEAHLQYMNRSHNSAQAQNSVLLASQNGFDNITIDLIYAIPAPDHGIWEKDLALALNLPVQHLSAYCLTIEPQTVFGKWLKNKKIQNTDDHFAAEQFDILLEKTAEKGFIQYEISNFGKPNFFSKHNTNYWKQSTYLGIGASAHSYDGVSRQYNIAHNEKYMKSLESNILACEKEILSPKDHANEYLMTGLRTMWGVDLAVLEQYQTDFLQSKQKELAFYQEKKMLILENGFLKLSQTGKLWADRISIDLFVNT